MESGRRRREREREDREGEESGEWTKSGERMGRYCEKVMLAQVDGSLGMLEQVGSIG